MNKRAEEAAEAVNRMINAGGGLAQREFIEQMSRDHPTLQQGFTRLCVAWFRTLAEQQGDERNTASIKLAQALKPILDVHHLPLI